MAASRLAILLGPVLAKADEHFAALRQFGLEPVTAATPSELVAAAIEPVVVVAPLSGDDSDCAVVGETAGIFPSTVIVPSYR